MILESISLIGVPESGDMGRRSHDRRNPRRGARLAAADGAVYVRVRRGVAVSVAWRITLMGIRAATVRSSSGPRRLWIRLRNRCLPWFFWSY